MDTEAAARRWAATWSRAWPSGDTLAGVTVLRFDADGKVVDQRDYWNELGGREPPYAGWSG